MKPYRGSYETLVNRMEVHARERPGKVAFRFLRDGVLTESRTFGELRLRAQSVAREVQQHARKGDRVLLSFAPGLAFLDAFLGCLVAGAIAVPVAPSRGTRSIQRLAAVINDARPAAILGSTMILDGLAKKAGPDCFELPRLVPTDCLPPVDSTAPCLPDANALAYLQYTSGSTRTPRGVMVTHRCLAHNCHVIAEAEEHDPDNVTVSWLPIFHDMGLIGGCLEPLYFGFTVDRGLR
jgi:acyl-CoA synthetase (AMP-forming)/AMP-acid ligase II